MVTISETAVQEIRRLQKSRQQPNSYLRIEVNQGGCSGLVYKLQLNETILEKDNQDKSQGLVIAIDPESSIYLEDLQIDYSEDLMGGAFRFDNAKAINICNCGQSFSIKHP